MEKILFLIWIFIVGNISCEKIKYYPDKDFREVKTLILAHRAGGGGVSPFQENSLDAAKYGLSIVDGIEVDIQISKDRTIWLSHDVALPECNGVQYNCFPEASDNQIVQLDTCNGSPLNFWRLETIFAYMAAHCPDKYISIDVKAWIPCGVSSANVLGAMNVMADEIVRLAVKYNCVNRVMVESETASFLSYLKNKLPETECYLTSLGDFERAMLLCLEAGFNGISFKYKFDEALNVEKIQLIRKKGLKIQLWTVNNAADINEALSINPDFIQTDNLNYFQK